MSSGGGSWLGLEVKVVSQLLLVRHSMMELCPGFVLRALLCTYTLNYQDGQSKGPTVG